MVPLALLRPPGRVRPDSKDGGTASTAARGVKCEVCCVCGHMGGSCGDVAACECVRAGPLQA